MKAKSTTLFGLLNVGGPTFIQIFRAQDESEDTTFTLADKTKTKGAGSNIKFDKMDIPLQKLCNS